MKISNDLNLSNTLVDQLGPQKYTDLNEVWHYAFGVIGFNQKCSIELLSYLPAFQKRLTDFLGNQCADICQYPGGHLVLDHYLSNLLTRWLEVGFEILRLSPDLSSNPENPLEELIGGKVKLKKRKSLGLDTFIYKSLNVLGGNSKINRKILLAIIRDQCKHDDRISEFADGIANISEDHVLERIRARYNAFSI